MKDVRFIWGLPQEDSFMKLKELITLAPVLVRPNNNLPFRLEANSSSIATGAVVYSVLLPSTAFLDAIPRCSIALGFWTSEG
jgi:hypothetical protein